MGLYRANMNIPGLRFGKTGTFNDDDPVIKQWVAAGSLIRLDGPDGPPRKVAAAPAPAPEVDGEVEFVDEAPQPEPAPKVTPKPAPKVTPKPEVAEAPIERKEPEPSGINFDLGIRFDDEDDD